MAGVFSNNEKVAEGFTQHAVARASARVEVGAMTVAEQRLMSPKPVAGSTMCEYRCPSMVTNWWRSPEVDTAQLDTVM